MASLFITSTLWISSNKWFTSHFLFTWAYLDIEGDHCALNFLDNVCFFSLLLISCMRL